METVRVNLKKKIDDSYDLLIGQGLFGDISSELKEKPIAESYAIITDSNVEKAYGKNLLKDFHDKGLHAHLIRFPAGEKYKSRETKEQIEDKMLKLGFGRDTCVVALGGGVVGDVAGFVAATYMRGINYVQIPTTMLAMVDSSIGGKVAVNTREAKNLIGSFHQPRKVFIDVDFLKTLQRNELVNGMVEAIKHALIMDKNFFGFLERNAERILNKNPGALKNTIKRSCEIKALIVSKDEKEKGIRKILNYGHTIGHAIESALNYNISHGQCVAIGMSYAAKLSSKLGFLDEISVIRQNNLLMCLGLAHRVSHHKLKPREILERIRYDKKISNGRMNFVLLNGIGNAFISDKVAFEDIGDILKRG